MEINPSNVKGALLAYGLPGPQHRSGGGVAYRWVDQGEELGLLNSSCSLPALLAPHEWWVNRTNARAQHF